MHYELFYSGQPGNLSATLSHNKQTVSTESGFADAKAAQKWAARVARDHKVANTPEDTENHHVSISGHKTFSL